LNLIASFDHAPAATCTPRLDHSSPRNPPPVRKPKGYPYSGLSGPFPVPSLLPTSKSIKPHGVQALSARVLLRVTSRKHIRKNYTVISIRAITPAATRKILGRPAEVQNAS